MISPDLAKKISEEHRERLEKRRDHILWKRRLREIDERARRSAEEIELASLEMQIDQCEAFENDPSGPMPVPPVEWSQKEIAKRERRARALQDAAFREACGPVIETALRCGFLVGKQSNGRLSLVYTPTGSSRDGVVHEAVRGYYVERANVLRGVLEEIDLQPRAMVGVKLFLEDIEAGFYDFQKPRAVAPWLGINVPAIVLRADPEYRDLVDEHDRQVRDYLPNGQGP